MSEQQDRNFVAEIERLSDTAVIDPMMLDAEFDDLDADVLKYRIGQLNDRAWQRILARCEGRRPR